MKETRNWNQGGLTTLNPGDTAVCQGGLNRGQIYGLFFYNSANGDANATVDVVWSNSQPPQQVVVPGTTAKAGRASVLFVSGDDTNSVSVSLRNNQAGAQIQCFIGSVKLPSDGSLHTKALPLDGQKQAFDQFDRFTLVAPADWCSVTIESDLTQFITVQITQDSAEVLVVNATQEVLPAGIVGAVGSASFTTSVSTFDSVSTPFQGDGTQMVWINADSVQNSRDATISGQALSRLYQGQDQAERGAAMA